MRKNILTILFFVSAMTGYIFILVTPSYAQNKSFIISGQVFDDTNRNGFKDPSEKPLANAQISLTGKNQTKTIAKTNSQGIYEFKLSQPGIYDVGLLSSDIPIYPGQNRSILISEKMPKATANFAATPLNASSGSTFRVSGINECMSYCPEAYPGSHCEQLSEDYGYCQCDNDHTNAETNNPAGCSTGGNTGGGCSAWGGVNNCSGWCQQNGGGYCLPSDDCATCHQTNNQTCNPDQIDQNGYTCNTYCTAIGQQCNQTSCSCEPLPAANYTVSGFVYWDKDGNGSMTAGDVPFPQNLTLTLQPGGGGSPTSIQTSGGYYSQTVTTAGTYSIGPTSVPSGYRASTLNPQSIQLNNTTPNQTVDFGLASLNQDYKVSGVVYIDTNKNKVKDANEIGVGDETVSVSSANGELNAQTNSSGQYTRALPSQGLYSIRLLTKPQYENTTPEIQNFSITTTNNAPIFNFGIYPKSTISPIASSSATPQVRFTKPATDNQTVSGIIEVQAVASVSGSTFTSFKICTDVANDCMNADPAALANKSNVTINVPGGADTNGLSNGNHTLTATAVAANGKTGTGTRIIKVQNASQSITPGQISPAQSATPVRTATPVPTSGGNTSTPIPNTATPVHTATPTPGACNNNNFCDFGENVNTCPGDCQVRCGDNICSQPQENQFSCAADCGNAGTSPTPTGNGTNTPTPTGVTGSTATPTRNPSHTATPTVPGGVTTTPGQTGTPTPSLSPAPTDTVLNLSVKLPGIGNKNGDVTNPVNKTVTASVALYNSSNQFVKQAEANLTFDGQVFKGTVNMGDVPAGSYTAYIKTGNSLIKRLTPTITGGNGGSVSIPQVELVTGDFDQTNKLDIVDFNKLLGCYGKDQQGGLFGILGTSNFTCGLQDVNDDGKVDEKDVNIFLRGFAIREGDKP